MALRCPPGTTVRSCGGIATLRRRASSPCRCDGDQAEGEDQSAQQPHTHRVQEGTAVVGSGMTVKSCALKSHFQKPALGLGGLMSQGSIGLWNAPPFTL